MNSSQVIEQGDVVVELKYCERCGGLWLRPVHYEASYCENCRAAIAAWPRIGRRGQHPRTFNHREAQGKRFVDEKPTTVINSLHGVAEVEEEREWRSATVAPEVRS